MHVDFIVLANYRTGSTFLCNSLNNQIEVSCFEEILNRSWPYSIADTHPEDQINKYITSSNSKKNAGFKILFDQLDPVKKIHNFDIYTWIKLYGIKVILVERRNVFLQYISFLTAKTTNEWQNRNNGPSPLTQIEVDICEYFSFKKLNEIYYKEVIGLLQVHDIPYKHCYYESLTSNYIDAMQSVLDFLIGQKADRVCLPGKYACIKQNTYSLKDRISNYDYVCKALSKDEDFFAAMRDDANVVYSA